MKIIYTNNKKEFISIKLKIFYKKNNITLKYKILYIYKKNRFVKRK